MREMNVFEEDKLIGRIVFSREIPISFDTKDEHLQKVLEWTIVNPVPLVGRIVSAGILGTEVEDIPLGNNQYPDAVRDFLQREYRYDVVEAPSIIEVLKGSSKSGNYGHSGRPGKIGGSTANVSSPLQALSAATVGGQTFTATAAGTTLQPGTYAVVGTYGNKKSAIVAANKLHPGTIPVRVNGTYAVLDTTPGKGITVGAGHKSGLPVGQYVSVYSVPTNKQAAVNKANKLGPGYTAIRANNAYHVVKTSTGAATAQAQAARTGKPVTVQQLYDKATPSQRALAKQTGLLPTDAVAEKYVKNQVLPAIRSGALMPPGKSFHRFNTSALSTVTAGKEMQSIKVKYDSSWDKRNHSSFSGSIRNVFKITPSENLNKAYQKEVNRVNNVKKNLYHGTHQEAGAVISSGGFKIPKSAKAGRMLGDGVYLAENSSKSVQYLGSSFSRYSRVRGVLLQAEAAMGKVSNTATTTTNPWKDLPYSFSRGAIKQDSVYAPKGKYSPYHPTLINGEYVVKEPKGVLPTYWLDIERH